MLRQVLELSMKEQDAAIEKRKQEEMQMRLMMEKSKIEEENQAILAQKDEELKRLK